VRKWVVGVKWKPGHCRNVLERRVQSSSKKCVEGRSRGVKHSKSDSWMRSAITDAWVRRQWDVNL